MGTISVGDKLWVMPNRVPVEVLNVWLDQDEVKRRWQWEGAGYGTRADAGAGAGADGNETAADG